MKKLSLSLLLFLLFTSSPFSILQAQDLTTFILVRHVEKVDDGTKDPALSDAGKERAQRLAEHLSETKITAIYSTPYERTQNTVASIAKQKEIEIQEYDPFGDDTLSKILKQQQGGIILIAGHSNTTPHLVNLLIGKEQFSQLDESDYDNLYVVTLNELGNGKVLHLIY